MEKIEFILEKWMSQRLDKIEVGTLVSRNPIAHKWKAPFRSLLIRELVFWRLTDLLEQAMFLVKQDRILGARVLIRSALETLAILIYLNQKINSLVTGSITYEMFESMTLRLLIGTKRPEAKIESINILTVLEKCEKVYPGIFDLYKNLSESSHPNFEGMSLGYSEYDDESITTLLRSRWKELYFDDLENLMMICIHTFEMEYNNVWSDQFQELETWFVKNDAELEMRKKSAFQ